MLQNYLNALNDAQKEAVQENSVPLLVLAGAGSGKTRVITTKIAYCIEALGYNPYTILAVTFTNKAAAEMRERVVSMADGADAVMIKTFHAFGAWLLRRYADRLGLSTGFTIYDDDDAVTLLHGLYPHFKRKELKPITKAISRAKDYCLSPLDDLSEVSRDPKFPEMYQAYEAKLHAVGNADFGDLIYRAIELIEKHADIRYQLQSRFRVVLVDEYQDSNVAQFRLLQSLKGPQTFLCVVGDDDQSIYRFRGAEIQNILTFPQRFPGTRVIKLEENYRSTGNILAIAASVVKNNSGRHGKELRTSQGPGKKPEIIYVADQFAEARYCADLVDRFADYDGTAILYRTNAQSAAFETVFTQRRIPYKIIGALRFYDREEVKDALALLSLCLNPSDEVAFKRMINKPKRGIGPGAVDTILELAAEYGGNCLEALRVASEGGLKGKAVEGSKKFLAWYAAAVEQLEALDLPEFTRITLRDSGIILYHQEQDMIASTQKVKNLEELVNATASYPSGKEGLALFLESLELDPTRLGDEDPSAKHGVTLITMHNTKGLEFDRVVITGMEEGLFPGRADASEEDIEEERRIFYVSITRARKDLYFTCCRQRALWGRTSFQMPSRFLQEIPESLVEIHGGGIQKFSSSTLGAGKTFGSFGTKGSVGTKGSSVNQRTGFSSAAGSSGVKPVLLSRGGAAADLPKAAFPGSRRNASKNGAVEQKFTAGDRIYHDSFGKGFIMSSVIENGREVVMVGFDSGKKSKFLPAYAPLEKISQD